MPFDTNRPTVVALGDPERDDWSSARAILQSVGADIAIVRARGADEFVAEAQGAAGLVQGPVRYTAELLDKFPGLRAIGAMGIGVDTIDVVAATERKVIVFNLPGLIHRDVAAHAFMFVLALARQLVPYHLAMREARRGTPLAPIPHLHETTLGLVAFGSIAREVVKYAQAAGMRVIAYDPIVDAANMAEAGVTKVELDDLFAQADFVSVHVPLSESTFHLIGERQFSRMKPTAYFLNTGRGRVVDEAALIKVLQEHKIAGAGLDVLEQEPPSPDNPLLKMDNVLLTPHSASQSANTRDERRQRIAEEMARVFSGYWPRHGLVNRELRGRMSLKD